MRNVQRIREMASTSAGQEQYLEWLANPHTQAFIGAFREMGRPQRPDMINVQSAFLALGESIGWNSAAELMENPGTTSSKVGRDLVASYGAGADPKLT